MAGFGDGLTDDDDDDDTEKEGSYIGYSTIISR
jgi:hypothetical protein